MISTTSKTIVGAFETRAAADRAAQELMQNGFGRNDVQVTTNDTFASDAARGNAGLSGAYREQNTGGGISGFFRNLFGAREDEDARYTDTLYRGGAVVSVRTDENKVNRALDIIERHNPIDIDKNSGHQRAFTDRDTDGKRSIPVVDEELEVGKRTVERGGVRVYSHVVKEPVEETVTLHEERVNVERRPANRPATEADFRLSDEVIEVSETVEEPVVSKRARVKEEVVIEKEGSTRTETVRDTLRRSEVNVEKLGDDKISQSYDDDFRRDFNTRYGSTAGASYDTYAPAYQYGLTAASDARYKGRSWEDIQENIRTDYMRHHPNSKWEQMKGAVRYGWEKMSGQRK